MHGLNSNIFIQTEPNSSSTYQNFCGQVLAYRDQYIAERPFARLKGKIINLLPLYLHRDDHATGLIHILTIALRVMSIIEFVVRRSLAENQETLDNIYDGNPKRQTARPSTELILHTFRKINLDVYYDQDGQVIGKNLDLSIKHKYEYWSCLVFQQIFTIVCKTFWLIGLCPK
ncbi:hypothetical protein QUF58_01185 [Anaerolineales bacterium HSG24]|nr:hypothetical protein [Anaerolineales bacterium HSG24]